MMNDQDTPQSEAPQEETPTPTPPPPTSGSPESSNRGVMIVLSYLWILFLIPLLIDKDDPEVQWHAKHGLVLTVLEILVYVVLSVVGLLPVLGCVFALFIPFVVLAFSIIRLICIVKGLNGERFIVPGIRQYAERF